MLDFNFTCVDGGGGPVEPPPTDYENLLTLTLAAERSGVDAESRRRLLPLVAGEAMLLEEGPDLSRIVDGGGRDGSTGSGGGLNRPSIDTGGVTIAAGAITVLGAIDDKSAEKIVKTVKSTGAVVSGPIPLPTHKRIFTVLRSPHVNKKAREQFQLCSYKRMMDIYSSSSKTIDALMKLELPSGVDVEIKV